MAKEESEKATHVPPSDEKEPLYPPVLPAWGSMFPGVPPRGYGDISFDPTEKPDPDPNEAPPDPTKLTGLDKKAYELLQSIFPSTRR